MKKTIGLGLILISANSFAIEIASQNLISNSQQLIVVSTASWNSVTGQMQRFERDAKNHDWKMVGKPIPVVVGKSGMGLDEQLKNNLSNDLVIKNEGDNRTPVGVYELGPAFGFDEKINSKADYFPITNTSICVDDSKSVYYNQLIDSDKIPQKDWNSGEQMRQVPQYKVGAMVQYNPYPAKAGAGSCIFLHIWKSPTTGTAGCIAMKEKNLQENLHWLNSRKNPVIAIFPTALYNQIKSELKLPSLI